jgi:hypothetical protein
MSRKRIGLISLLLLNSLSLLAQSNSYPTTGVVSISNYSPLLVLQRNTDEGGFIQGVQTKFKNGTNNWYFGNLHSDSWIVSKGDYTNPKFTILQTGNVGIGTTSPNATLQIGDSNNSGNPAVETEIKRLSLAPVTHSGSDWFFTTRDNNPYANLDIGYSSNKAITLRSDGNVGIGTNSPATKLHISSAGNSGSLDYNMILQKTVVTDNDKSAVGLLFSTECCGPFGKSAIVHERTGGYGVGDLHFLNNNTIDNTNPTLVNSRMTISSNGNVGIGTPKPTSKLTVAGNINSREVKVSVDAGADFVFEKDYALPSLQEVEKYVAKNKHLPEIASAKEMQKEGINLSEMNIKLLQKIEELTLYVIEQNKRIELQQKENQSLEKRVKILERK